MTPVTFQYDREATLVVLWRDSPQVLALIGRKEQVVKRTAEEIKADKERLANTLAKQSKRDAAKRSQRVGVS